jgi:hypothetical protein
VSADLRRYLADGRWSRAAVRTAARGVVDGVRGRR